MSLWNWWSKRTDEKRDAGPEPAEESGPIPLPAEPYVFECRTCGKVFERRRLHPLCPECDSPEVELLA
jgi:Zn finger protein HypA/HybF involved in hydrogenase expression